MTNQSNPETVFETDVLVIGGGLAGIFAAVKAREQGVDVTLVSKGKIGRSGMTPWANTTFVVTPDWENKIGKVIDQAHVGGEYINNRDWTKRVADESYARFQDLISWGLPFLKDEKGDFKRLTLGSEAFPGIWMGSDDQHGAWVRPLRDKSQKVGVHILEKIMIVDLIKQDGRVVGAIGISGNTFDLVVIKAKATVICMGAGGFKPVGGWPMGDLTDDGQIMAYKAGAEITGKEFEDFHNGMVRRTGSIYLPPMAAMTNVEGSPVPGMGFNLNADFEAHAGRAPLYRGKDEVFGAVANGLCIHTTEGIWPVDENCASGVPGLYSAGDSCATILDGATYGLMGSGTMNAAVTGTRAGIAATKYAKQMGKPNINSQELLQLKDSILLPAKRKGGFSPNWVTQLLKDAMVPYYILRIKHGERLQSTLKWVEFMRDNLSPKLFARDPHELRLAHETKNMIINAEMKMKASLFRTESRGTHYREDYPRRVDPDWLAWVMIKEVNGKMTLYKKQIPKEWWPDLTIPYEKRYTTRFPGE
jgi:succinate dehydrogenase/fumarate reductase flavoprotein subunit